MSEGATDLRDNLEKHPLITAQLRELEAEHGQTGQWVVSVLACSHARSLDRRMRGVPAHTQIGDEPLSQSVRSFTRCTVLDGIRRKGDPGKTAASPPRAGRGNHLRTAGGTGECSLESADAVAKGGEAHPLGAAMGHTPNWRDSEAEGLEHHQPRDSHIRAFGYKHLMGLLPTLARQRG